MSNAANQLRDGAKIVDLVYWLDRHVNGWCQVRVLRVDEPDRRYTQLAYCEEVDTGVRYPVAPKHLVIPWALTRKQRVACGLQK